MRSKGRFLSRRDLLRLGIAAGGGALALSALAGCGEEAGEAAAPVATKAAATEAPVQTVAAKPAEAKAATVKFWKPPHGPETELWPPLFKIFNAEHPKITIDHKVIPWPSVTEQFTAAFAGGAPPDVFYLPDEWYPPYAKQEQLLDLTPFFKDRAEEYNGAIWNAGHYLGKLWGVPFLAVMHTFIAHMEVLEAAGVTKVPESWDEIRETAKKVHDPQGKGNYGIFLPTWWTFAVPLLATGGAGMFTEDLMKMRSKTEGGIKAWKTCFETIGAQDKTSVPIGFTDDQLWALASKKNLGIGWTEGSQIKAKYRKEAGDIKLVAFPEPKTEGTDGKPAVWANAGYMFVAGATKEQDATLEFYKWLTSKFIQEEFVVKGLNNVPPMRGIDIPKLMEQDPVVTDMLGLMDKYGVGTQISSHWIAGVEALAQEASGVISGLKTAEKALEDFEALMQPKLDGS